MCIRDRNEIAWPLDLRLHLESGYFEAPPDNEVLGPIRPRGPANGLVLRGGHKVATWGDTDQVDFTFSAAKSYLSMLAGITWRHLLQNTSEWEGELFGKSDRIDRNRNLAVEGKGRKGDLRPLGAPGTVWEYNDVRVNRLALALLRVFRRPLPDVFRERIMDPIGASDTWSWHGYRTSTVEVDGRPIESVSGGTHWGGGVLIHAEDQARIGLLMARGGEWGGRRILPEAWVRESVQPCALNPVYGLLWWLNTGGARYKSAPEDSFFASGAGGNITWIAPSRGIVAVVRWMDPGAMDTFVRLTLQALE